MKNYRAVGFGASILGLALLVGCGSSGDGSDVTGSGDKTSSSSDSKNGGFEGLAGSGGGNVSTSSSSSSGGAGNVGNVEPGSSCATSSASVTAPPVHLVFMIDRSGSMGNSKEGQNLSLRWQPVVAGLDSFFADSASSNISASVTFYSQSDNECSASTYQTPAVAMTQLPNGNAFSDAFSHVSPNGGTPTKPALEGAIAYAQQVKATLPAGEKVAIVLATDGEPNDCSSTVDNVAAAAATVASDIPTYVIGVGPDTTNLDAIAQGGNTDHAIMIATNNTAQVSSDLRTALGQIAQQQLGCSYDLPTPPAGQTLDVNSVNVDFTPNGGQAQTLAYSVDCSNANGWHYDNAAAPTQIVMCGSSCSTLSNADSGKIDIVFGCAINAAPGTDLPGGGVK